MARHKTLKAHAPVPQDDTEARAAIREIGDLSREITRMEAEMNDRVAAIKQQFGDTAEPLKDLMDAKIEGVRVFAEANRDRLTKGGKVKFHKFTTGMISWRLRQAKVTIRGKDDVLEALKSLGLTRFIRVKEEPNKEAMLEDREAAASVAGITIGSDGEDFIVEPSETDLPEGD